MIKHLTSRYQPLNGQFFTVGELLEKASAQTMKLADIATLKGVRNGDIHMADVFVFLTTLVIMAVMLIMMFRILVVLVVMCISIGKDVFF